MKTGILGGTFNPIHFAHLRIAEEVREKCDLDRVLFLPAATPPHKPLADDIPFADRLAMAELAVTGNPAFAVSDLEGRRPGKSYSVKTLELLHQAEPEDSFYFIIGMDSYRSIDTWKDYPRLFELTNLVVSTRPGSPAGDPLELLPVVIRGEFCYDEPNVLRHRSGNRVILLEETFLDISSTHIRQLVAEGRSIRYLLPEAVEEYINRYGFYRDREVDGKPPKKG
ncbi:MAG: nicotinate-nucleotide adenylyltransferase [Syntrophotaleaceae bacterium]